MFTNSNSHCAHVGVESGKSISRKDKGSHNRKKMMQQKKRGGVPLFHIAASSNHCISNAMTCYRKKLRSPCGMIPLGSTCAFIHLLDILCEVFTFSLADKHVPLCSTSMLTTDLMLRAELIRSAGVPISPSSSNQSASRNVGGIPGRRRTTVPIVSASGTGIGNAM